MAMQPYLRGVWIVLLAGCASAPPVVPELVSARQAYAQVNQNAQVVRLAPVELEQTRIALMRAEASQQQDNDRLETRHLAYLAQRQATIAQLTAAGREAEIRIEQATLERERLQADARARAADAQVNRLQRALEATRAPQSSPSGPTPVASFGPILFEFAATTLRPGAAATVNKVARMLRQYPRYRVLIEGHTDAVGTAQANQRLAQRRAQAVRQALIRAQVEPGRIEVRAYGEQKPVTENRHRAGRQHNRRVEVLVFDGEVPPL